MKKWICLLLTAMLALLSVSAVAAEYVFDGDADYEYTSDSLTIGIKKVENTAEELTYFVADITIASADQLRSAMAAYYENNNKGSKREFTSVIGEKHGAVLAINADNFKSHTYGIIIRNGVLERAKDTTRHMLAVAANGDLVVYNGERPKAKELAEQLMNEGVRDTYEFGPVLVQDGQATDLTQNFKLIVTRDSILEPRTAIGQLGELHYLVIVVDGRREGYSKGINLSGLQSLFLQYGAQTAFNLDGGGSTTLYFNGEVLNRPSGGRERSVSDILYFQ